MLYKKEKKLGRGVRCVVFMAINFSLIGDTTPFNNENRTWITIGKKKKIRALNIYFTLLPVYKVNFRKTQKCNDERIFLCDLIKVIKFFFRYSIYTVLLNIKSENRYVLRGQNWSNTMKQTPTKMLCVGLNFLGFCAKPIQYFFGKNATILFGKFLYQLKRK